MTLKNDVLITEPKVLEVGPTVFEVHTMFRKAIENEDQFVLHGLQPLIEALRANCFLTDEEENLLADRLMSMQLRSGRLGKPIPQRERLDLLTVYCGVFNRAELVHANQFAVNN